MKTYIFTYKTINKAANIIKKGGIIAFPTETVYGLGCNTFNLNAIKKVYKVKGRPADNPLIVHIADKKWLFDLADIDKDKINIVNKLISKFWPGPLTLVLKKKKNIKDISGLNTIAIRMPKNKIALKFIKVCKCPISAPSANISGRPSSTSFNHVLDDFDGKIDGIIKTKKLCDIGVESTVIDLTSKNPTILRFGGIDIDDIKKIIPNIVVVKNVSHKPKSPGMKYNHYQPNAKVILFTTKNKNKIFEYKKKLEDKLNKVVVIDTNKIKNISKKLFDMYRQCDKKNIDFILITEYCGKYLSDAINDRIKKSATKII